MTDVRDDAPFEPDREIDRIADLPLEERTAALSELADRLEKRLEEATLAAREPEEPPGPAS
ncbi:MAG: hypothetical protein ACRDJ4_15695 [Actinomycetota bacterium]